MASETSHDVGLQSNRAIRLGRRANQLERYRRFGGCPAYIAKIFLFFRIRESDYILPIPRHKGALRGRHERGAGCDGRGSRLRRGCGKRTAKPCGSTPRCWRQASRNYPPGDGDKKPDHREERGVSYKTIRVRECRVLSGGPVVTNSCAFSFCTRGCGCIGARHSPRPSLGGSSIYNPGASRRGMRLRVLKPGARNAGWRCPSRDSWAFLMPVAKNSKGECYKTASLASRGAERMSKQSMREEAERLIRETMERKALVIKQGNTRIETICGKCGAPNRVSGGKGRHAGEIRLQAVRPQAGDALKPGCPAADMAALPWKPFAGGADPLQPGIDARFGGRHEFPIVVFAAPARPVPANHRVVLAPLTRMRAEKDSFAPRPLNAEYYAQRATPGGLLIAEASPVAATARGNPGTPGIYSRRRSRAGAASSTPSMPKAV